MVLCMRTCSWRSSWEFHICIHGLQEERDSGFGMGFLKTSELTPTDTHPPTKTHLLIFSNGASSWTKYGGGHSRSNNHNGLSFKL